MSQSSGSSGRGDVKGTDLDTWVEPGWPDSDLGWPPGPAANRPRRARLSGPALLAVTLLGLALGAGIALAVTYHPAGQGSAAGLAITPSDSAAPSSAPSAVTPSTAPSVVEPSQAGGSLAPGSGSVLPGGVGALPGGDGSGGQMLFLGQVTEIGRASSRERV